MCRMGATDVRNYHAHLLMTTRRVTAEGLAEKSFIERENKWLGNDLPSAQLQLREVRQVREQVANEHLARAGLDIRIDHRSHQERGLEIEPTEHMGVHATQMERRGKAVGRTRLDREAAQRNAELIRRSRSRSSRSSRTRRACLTGATWRGRCIGMSTGRKNSRAPLPR